MKLLMKAKKMPIGTVSKGMKKVGEGKWVPVKKVRATRLSELTIDDIKQLKTNKEYRDKFILANQGLIKHEINKMWSRIKDVAESKQNANEGVLKAIAKFDLKKNPTGRGFATYVGSYIRYSMSNAIKAESEKGIKESSLNIKHGDDGVELQETIADPKSESEIKKIDFKQSLGLLRDKIKNDKAKKVLDLMVEGYSKASIAQRLKMSKAGITLLVQRHIAPYAKKVLNKSNEWTVFLTFLEEF